MVFFLANLPIYPDLGPAENKTGLSCPRVGFTTLMCCMRYLTGFYLFAGALRWTRFRDVNQGEIDKKTGYLLRQAIDWSGSRRKLKKSE
jgi:hypothetical protein